MYLHVNNTVLIQWVLSCDGFNLLCRLSLVDKNRQRMVKAWACIFQLTALLLLSQSSAVLTYDRLQPVLINLIVLHVENDHLFVLHDFLHWIIPHIIL